VHYPHAAAAATAKAGNCCCGCCWQLLLLLAAVYPEALPIVSPLAELACCRLTPVSVEVLQVLEQLLPVVGQDVHNGLRLVGVGHKHLQQQQKQQETIIEEEVITLASFTGYCLAGTRLQLPNIPSASYRVM
jgi:hypothetical protein